MIPDTENRPRTLYICAPIFAAERDFRQISMGGARRGPAEAVDAGRGGLEVGR